MMRSQIFNKIIVGIALVGIIAISIPQGVNAASPSLRETQQNAAVPTQTQSTTNTTSNAAQEAAFRQQTQRLNNISAGDAQANAASGDTSGVSGSASAGTGAAVSDALGCSAASLLGQAVATGLKSLASKAVGKVASLFTTVPISSNEVADNNARAADAADANASTNAFQQIFGVAYGASFNGIAYCIVNGLITYIANSTIAWANSGFQGNPAFLENPENFFTTLADKQASQFISSVAYNSTGVNVCEPFRVDLAIALSESYGQQGGTGNLGCSMDQISQNFSNFANGGAGLDGNGGMDVSGYWSNWNQMRQDQNNPWGAYIEAGKYMKGQIAVKNNTAKFELGLNNGFLNFKKCEDKAAVKKGDNSSCKTTTPGKVIEEQLNSTLNLGKQRLVMAEKIDQVITAVANALVKKALNTVLEKGN